MTHKFINSLVYLLQHNSTKKLAWSLLHEPLYRENNWELIECLETGQIRNSSKVHGSCMLKTVMYSINGVIV